MQCLRESGSVEGVGGLSMFVFDVLDVSMSNRKKESQHDVAAPFSVT